MKFGTKLKKRNNKDFLLRLYFIIGLIVIIIAFTVYTNILMRNVKKDIKLVPNLYARFISTPDNVDLEDFLIQYFMSNVIPNINYPIILADSLKVPFSWENIEIDKINYYLLDAKEQKRLKKMMKKMEKMRNIIPLKKNIKDEKPFSYLYYGESTSMKQLRMIPYLEFLIFVIFIFLGVWGILIIKKHEKDNLWIGLAKETAHQFGTPISSLLGWIDILEMKFKEMGADEDMMLMLTYMKADIKKLNYIASRFGKVGSKIELKSKKIHPILQIVVDYFKKRLPGFDSKIDIIYTIDDENIELMIDESLFRWALDNIIKNAIDAMKGKSGKVEINVFKDDKTLHIRVSDEGSGIPKSMYKKIFEPGITSKHRGWGLGLSLSKRIIEDYHNGKIYVLKSELDKGTTIEIVLPLKLKK